jgi:hypothetical protein
MTMAWPVAAVQETQARWRGVVTQLLDRVDLPAGASANHLDGVLAGASSDAHRGSMPVCSQPEREYSHPGIRRIWRRCRPQTAAPTASQEQKPTSRVARAQVSRMAPNVFDDESNLLPVTRPARPSRPDDQGKLRGNCHRQQDADSDHARRLLQGQTIGTEPGREVLIRAIRDSTRFRAIRGRTRARSAGELHAGSSGRARRLES